jgi:hypothetical protein
MSNVFASQVAALATDFAIAIVSAIRTASVAELSAFGAEAPATSTQRRGPGRPRKAPTVALQAAAPKAPATKVGPKAGRLPRRSPADIANALAKVVALLKSSKAPLRSEQIRAKLGMHPKEMPRVLKEGLEKKVLKSKGQKRSTAYSLA